MILFLLALFCFSTSLRAQSLPLEGYYRQDAYMPLRLDASAAVEGRGVMPVTISTAGLAPLLVTSEIVTLDVTINGLVRSFPLRPLLPDEVLVVQTGSTPAPAETLAGKRAVTLTLPADLFDQPDALAWDAVDVIVFDAAPRDDVTRALLAGGTTVVTSRPIGSMLAWRQVGDVCVAVSPSGGPTSARPDEEYFEPATAWPRGRPAALRRLILLLAIGVTLGLTGVSLLGGKRGVAAVVVCAMFATVGVFAWPALAPRALIVEGQIVTPLPTPRTDRYLYAVNPRGGLTTFHARRGELIYPLATSSRHRADRAPRLMVSPGGATLTMTLPPAALGVALVRSTGDITPPPEPLDVSRLIRPRYGNAPIDFTRDGVTRLK